MLTKPLNLEEQKKVWPSWMGTMPRMGRVWPETEDQWLKDQWVKTKKSITQLAEETGRGFRGIEERLIKHYGLDYALKRGPQTEATAYRTPDGKASPENLQAQLNCKLKQLEQVRTENAAREAYVLKQINKLREQLDEPTPPIYRGDPYADSNQPEPADD